MRLVSIPYISTVGNWALFILVAPRGSFPLSKARPGSRDASMLAGHLLYLSLKRLLSLLLLCLSLLGQQNLLEMKGPCRHDTRLVWLQAVPACSGAARALLPVWPCGSWGPQPSVCPSNGTNMSLQHSEGQLLVVDWQIIEDLDIFL